MADDDFTASSLELAVVLIAIVSCLILVTIIFELTKDYAVSCGNKYTRPIILTLFSEMTVLGFLSMVTFAVAYGGTLDDWSSVIYGEDGEGYIESTLESIHYLLFLVMVVTIIQVFMLISIGNTAMSNFDVLNLITQKEEDMIPIMDKLEDLPNVTFASWIEDYLVMGPVSAWEQHTERLHVEATAVFYSLRREFLECRNSLPPYDLTRPAKRLPHCFDFARYQSIFLSGYLVKIVYFTPLTWFSLWLCAVVVFALMMAVANTSYDYFMAVIWLLLGYADLFIIYQLKFKCTSILEHLVNPMHFKEDWKQVDEIGTTIGSNVNSSPNSPAGSHAAPARRRSSHISHSHSGAASRANSTIEATESTSLLAGNSSSSYPVEGENHPDSAHSSLVKRVRCSNMNMPKWTSVKKQPQSWLSYLSLGKVEPNKQERLFWGDKIGRDLNIYVLRVHLIAQSVFFAVAGCYFIPDIYEDHGYYWGTAYLFLIAILIPIQLFDVYPELIVQMSQVASTGLFKEKKIVTEVIRAQKMARLVRLLMLMTKLKNCAQGKKEGDAEAPAVKPTYDPNDPKIRAEIEEIGKIFDTYDVDGGGEVDTTELANMFHSFGIALSDEEMQEMFIQLDADNSGTVSKQELIDWKMSQIGEHKAEDMKQMAVEIFNMFDEDGSGEISIEEFKEALLKFDSGLSEAEIIEIANDLDESGDGNLSLEEFQKAIEQALEY